MPNFQEFRKRSGRLATAQPTVTVQKGGTFSFNDKAYELLGNPKAVILLFDPDERIIGFQAADPKRVNAYPLHAQSETNFLINGLGFAQYWQIPIDQGRRYIATLMDDVLAVDLNSEYTEVTSNRNRKKQSVEISNETVEKA